MTSADLLLHPVRLRVVQAFLGDRTLTTGDLRRELPDVPAATLYRHVGVLADAGVLAVVGERKVRGASERSYRLRTEAASVTAEDAARMSVEDHRRAFTAFAAGLLADMDRYLDRGRRAAESGGECAGPDLARDLVGYRQVGFWLTDEEFGALLADLRAVLVPWLANGPADGRRRRLLSTILLPAE